ncbi:MAG TPA: acyltransferase, partial [Solirubrobacteraceae bacterium]|nr:acyltransferase [Solirubrobacteraceae bacterium]
MRSTALRPEIQALRGVAVLTVVVFHLWPSVLPGGFVGVDVFFVISGFLITGQLVREVDRTSRVSLAGFWARRARRILPAALVVLAFCALATKAVVPETHWREFFAEITASTAYVENWQLAEAAVDYADADDAASPVRHFWSLSVEEQFYLVWPLLIMLALVWGRRAIGPVLGAVVLVSLVWSIVATAGDPAAAYFITPTRAWEFGLGGLLALVPLRGRSPALSWLGIGAIALAAVLYSGDTPFPGVAALLPVLGAAAVIAARSFAFRPLERVGDVSYSVYLWHWPLIVLAPFAGGASKVVLLALTFVLGWASKVAVEDPVRRLRWRPRAILAPAAAATAAVLLLSLSGTAALDDRLDREQDAVARVLERQPPCFGAAAMGGRCRPQDGVIPTPVVAREARNAPCGILRIED